MRIMDLFFIVVIAIPSILKSSVSANKIHALEERLSRVLDQGSAYIVDTHKSTIVVGHGDKIIVHNIETGLYTNIFDFSKTRINVVENTRGDTGLGGALSHEGRFLTISKSGWLENKQKFYIFERMDNSPSSLQTKLREATNLVDDITAVIAAYTIDLSINSQYLLYKIVQINHPNKTYIMWPFLERFNAFHLIVEKESERIVGYSKLSTDSEVCTTCIFDLSKKQLQLLHLNISSGNKPIISSFNGRYICYGIGDNIICRVDRLNAFYKYFNYNFNSICAISSSGDLGLRYDWAKSVSGNGMLCVFNLHDGSDLHSIEIEGKLNDSLSKPLLLDTGRCFVLRRAEMQNGLPSLYQPLDFLAAQELATTADPSVRSLKGRVKTSLHLLSCLNRQEERSVGEGIASSANFMRNLYEDEIQRARLCQEQFRQIQMGIYIHLVQRGGINARYFWFNYADLKDVPPQTVVMNKGKIVCPMKSSISEHRSFDTPTAIFPVTPLVLKGIGLGAPFKPKLDSSADISVKKLVKDKPRHDVLHAPRCASNLAKDPVLTWYKSPNWLLKGMAISTATLAITYGALRWWNAGSVRTATNSPA